MPAYYTELVWKIDLVLAAGALFLAMAIISYATIIGFSTGRRARRLFRIKKNVYKMIAADDSASGPKGHLGRVTSRDFLDVEINRIREAIFFNDAEQEVLKKHFAASKHIAGIKRTARYSINKWSRIEAILSLGYAGCSSALDIITKSLHSRDRDIAYFSMVALGQIKTAESAKILLNFLRKNTFGRYKIITLLKNFPPEIASEVFMLSNDPDPAVLIAMIRIVSGLKPEGYMSKVEAFLGDKSDEVRAAACECLGSFGEKAVKKLSTCLKDGFWLVRVNAVSALSAICGAGCIPEIVRLLGDDSWSVIESVKKVMTEHVEAALPYMEKFLHGKDPIAKKASTEALVNSGYIIKVLKNILSGKDKEKADSIRLLKGLVKSNIHFGLETALERFEGASRAKILEIVREIDEPMAEHIQKKLNKEIDE